MKVLKTRLKLIALVPFVAVAILLVGNRIFPDQNRALAANDVGIIIQGGIVVQGGITQGQVLRFNVARLAIVAPGPPGSNPHPGGVNLELKVFDSNGNILASNTYVFPQNQNGDVNLESSFFDLNSAQLPASAFDNSGRAQLTGIVRAIPGPHLIVNPGPPNCGFVASGEISNIGDVNRETLVHIAGAPIADCPGR